MVAAARRLTEMQRPGRINEPERFPRGNYVTALALVTSASEGPGACAGPDLDCGCDQPLTNAPPLALHWTSDIIAKPLLLQAFRPLQELLALLQALWPLQALAAMHLPCAASAGVDAVDTTAPARNSVAAAAASVAPDLESNFIRRSPRLYVDDRMTP